MKQFLRSNRFWKDQDGGQVLEWPMLAALIALVILAAWTGFGTSVSDAFSAIGTVITTATGQVQNVPLP